MLHHPRLGCFAFCCWDDSLTRLFLFVCSHFSYTCLAPTGPGQPSLGCTTTWSAVLAVLGVTVVSDGKVGTSTVVSETSNGITAYGIQVRFKSGDPTPAPRSDESVSAIQARKVVRGRRRAQLTHLKQGFSVVTRTSGRSSIPIPTQLLVPVETDSPSSSGGVSTPAAIGIGVGSAVAALLLASVGCFFFFLRRRRKKKRAKPAKQPAQPPPVPPKELPATPVPRHTVPLRYELPDQPPSRRPSMSTSKRHMSMTPQLGRTPTMRGERGDSDVLAGYYLAVELEAPSEVSFRDRSTPESASSGGWTDRQMRGATMPTPWI